jgi:hypothetical protein
MRTGRPRKADAARYANGRAKAPTAKEREAAMRALEDIEKQTVLAQPHRRGERSWLAESPLGRFCLAHGLPREYFDAGEDYASLKRRWLAAYDAPMQDRLGGAGRDIDMEQIRRWGEMIRVWERAMLDAGGYSGRLSVMSLVMDRPAIQPRIYPSEAIAALNALARFQGRLGKQS